MVARWCSKKCTMQTFESNLSHFIFFLIVRLQKTVLLCCFNSQDCTVPCFRHLIKTGIKNISARTKASEKRRPSSVNE